jgi:hypothetical protein
MPCSPLAGQIQDGSSQCLDSWNKIRRAIERGQKDLQFINGARPANENAVRGALNGGFECFQRAYLFQVHKNAPIQEHFKLGFVPNHVPLGKQQSAVLVANIPG